MRHRQVTVGVVLLGLLGLLDALSPWLFPAPAEAPPFVDVVSVVLGVGTLVALAVWLARPSRAALWVAVVLRAISALLALPAFIGGEIPLGLGTMLVVLIVLTIVGIVLVRGALGRSRTTAGL